jgi:hypothetical protein
MSSEPVLPADAAGSVTTTIKDPHREHHGVGAKGDRVFVHATVTTEAWTDKTTGDKWTPQRLLAEIVGPSLRWATTRIPREPAPRPPTSSRTTQAARRHDQVRGGRPWRSAPGASPCPPAVASA